MAMKGKMELTIGVSVGSSIQIAAGMIPILTLLAWPMGVGDSKQFNTVPVGLISYV
jgi:Ca2+/H+ antiporter